MSEHLPDNYAKTLRTLIRFAVAMALFGLLIGIAFQESIKKFPPDAAPAGVHLTASLPLALVHGHVFNLGVLLPLALAGALVLARSAGGRPVGPRVLAWLRRAFLPFATATLLLQLFKGYYMLLSVRDGRHDIAAVDAAFLGGSHVLRYGIYAVVHTGMGISLGVFLVALWRSLGAAKQQ